MAYKSPRNRGKTLKFMISSHGIGPFFSPHAPTAYSFWSLVILPITRQENPSDPTKYHTGNFHGSWHFESFILEVLTSHVQAMSCYFTYGTHRRSCNPQGKWTWPLACAALTPQHRQMSYNLKFVHVRVVLSVHIFLKASQCAGFKAIVSYLARRIANFSCRFL